MGRLLRGGQLIWRSRWVTNDGIIECREALAFPGDPHRAVLLRRIIARRGHGAVSVALDPRAGFGRHRAAAASHRTTRHWTAGRRRCTCAGPATRAAPAPGQTGTGADWPLTLMLGRARTTTWSWRSRPPVRDRPPDPSLAWTPPSGLGARRSRAGAAAPPPRDARHAYAVLRGLTSAGGGMVAAATTSLPERAEAGRNYDYRYVWIRDQCYAGQAVAAAGADPLLDDAVRFVTDRLLDHGPELSPAYTVDGGAGPRPAHARPARLPGRHRHGRQLGQPAVPARRLRRGAAAVRRRRRGTTASTPTPGGRPDRRRRHRRPLERARRRDLGARRPTLDPQPADLRRRAARRRRAAARRRRAADWLALADTILADTASACVHPAGRWQRSPDDPGARRRAAAAGDPRRAARRRPAHHRHLAPVPRDLTEDGYAYRFRHDERPLARPRARSCCAGS